MAVAACAPVCSRALAAGGVLFFLSIGDWPGAFWCFFAMFLVLFTLWVSAMRAQHR